MTDTRRRDGLCAPVDLGTFAVGGQWFLYISDPMRAELVRHGLAILPNEDRKAIAERGV